MKKLIKFSGGLMVVLFGLFMSTSPILAATNKQTMNNGLQDNTTRGVVITESNNQEDNTLLVYSPSLGLKDTISTGGKGTGEGLGSQGAVVVSGNRLIAVNAGDNTISSFKIGANGVPHLADYVDSYGEMPVSVDIHGDMVYVVNAGSNSISGFHMDSNGHLTYREGSYKDLIGTGPAQISFDEQGHELIVTEKESNIIEVFPLGSNYLPETSVVTDSSGETPFGYEVMGGKLIVSEAFGGEGSALSTYKINSNGSLTPISQSVEATDQKAACWVAISKDNKFAYITNTASGTVSSYVHNGNGEVSLSHAVAATTEAGPIDMVVGGKILYVLTSQGINAFTMESNGTLNHMKDASSTSGAVGLVAYQM